MTASRSSDERSEFYRYGELGWALVKLDGKVPKGKGWQQTRPDPDPRHVAGLWNEWRKRWNVGVVLGNSGLAVVEYDTEAGGKKLLELFGGRPPKTPTVRTGSDRCHFYFLPPAGAEKRVRDGIELRLGAHQCAVPPSVHPETGKPYRWLRGYEPWMVPLAEVPAAVLEYLGESRSNGAAPPLPDVIPIGRIDDTLASLAGSMRRRGADEEAICAALVETLKRCEQGHTHTQADCRRIARSIAKKEPAVEAEPFTLEPLSARALCELPDPPASDELLGPLVTRGSRLVLGGHTGEGKTTLALQLVRAIVLGEQLLDWQGSGAVRALVIDAEQGLKTIKRRLREAGLAESELVDYVRVPDGLSLDSDERHVAELERVLREGDYALVCADPLYKLHAGDSNAEREAVDLMRRFDAWRDEFRFALLLPVHCRKPVPGLRFSIHDLFGSSAYVRGAEVVLGLARVRDGYAKLHWLKDREGDLPIGARWGLLFDREQGFRRDPDDGKPSTREQLAELRAADPALTQAKAAEAIGVSERTIRTYWNESNEGQITLDDNEATGR